MFSRKEFNQTSQTEFVEDGAFIESSAHKKFNLRDLKNNKNLLPFYILIAVLFFFFLLMIIKIIGNKQTPEAEMIKKVEEKIELDPLSLRANELRANLKDHDPTKQTLPFPQVDLEFNIN
ncbi:MAG: hypothetical protein UT13_C0001G0432 [Candidatus Pacebacteria bacterium GW2011_GWF2_38_9]|nr:MAG: hypothetical protein US01_C0001G0444 [candidate division TM6 bacterium GW2011_GWF2_28_16]KKQ88785.1 MAG: hypothetical protein UT13_C0001G0432 [Candidatus Pacebacteria bacterium GW2011_GWF2_38_9]MBU1033750.1 hypothetical protein [Patescibacteria group bacterium]HAZ73275.1 hypothetical protein [Candidatus Paceibacterota bacterium]